MDTIACLPVYGTSCSFFPLAPITTTCTDSAFVMNVLVVGLLAVVAPVLIPASWFLSWLGFGAAGPVAGTPILDYYTACSELHVTM